MEEPRPGSRLDVASGRRLAARPEPFDEAHGRIERRRIEATDVLRGRTDWPHAAQFAKIARSRAVRGVTSAEVEYLVTSLTKDRAGPADATEPLG